jgi:hypothetical protein
MALYDIQTSIHAGRLQVERLGYTQDWLRELQAEDSPGRWEGKKKNNEPFWPAWALQRPLQGCLTRWGGEK